jgi:hypothetical protein
VYRVTSAFGPTPLVVALDFASGAVVWQFDPPGGAGATCWSSPTITPEGVLLLPFIGLVWLVPALVLYLGIMWFLRNLFVDSAESGSKSGAKSGAKGGAKAGASAPASDAKQGGGDAR